MSDIKTRFAPSPTGFLHIGSLRTALYAYLFAKQSKGKIVLRIEDTDKTREVEGSKESLIKVLEDFGINFDEGPHKGGNFGPYIQSERKDLYQQHCNTLIEKGYAYKCFCSPERLNEMRESQLAAKQPPMYDRKCLNLSNTEISERINNGEKYVIRMKVPHEETIIFDDIVRKKVRFECKNIDDQVLLKSDGLPTYHLANVIDDHLMEINYVIRAEEWLPSTPKHILLYKFFDWQCPKFAHLPLLLNENKAKLSKRDGSVHVGEFMKEGCTVEGLLNFICLLGWHPGTKNEILSIEDMIAQFKLDKVHKAGAIVDRKKLEYFNWQWRRKIYLDSLLPIAKEIDNEASINNRFKFIFTSTENRQKFNQIRGKKLAELTKLEYNEEIGKHLITVEEKILNNPNDIQSLIGFYKNLPDYETSLFPHEKMQVSLETAKSSLEASLQTLGTIDSRDFNEEILQEKLINLAKNLNIKNGQLLWPMRVALSGLKFSPGVFEICEALGKEESINRLQIGINKL